MIDADPAARDKSVRVKVAAADQPVLPAPHPGMPFVPVEFAGLTVTPYVNQAGRLAYSLRATGVRAGRGSGRARVSEDGAREQRNEAHSLARACTCSIELDDVPHLQRPVRPA